MRSLKKVLTVLLSLSILLSLLVFPASAAEELTLSMDDATGKVGDTIDVNLNIANNPGFGALTVRVYYKDDMLTCTKAAAGEVWTTFRSENRDAADDAGKSILTALSANDEANIKADRKDAGWRMAAVSLTTDFGNGCSGDGVVAVLTFEIKSDVESATPLEVEIVGDVAGVEVGSKIPSAQPKNGSITIQGGTSTTTAIDSVTIAPTSIAAGQTATATAKAADGTVIPNTNVTWSIAPANQGVTVTDGAITTTDTADGDYTITATGKNDATGTASAKLTVTKSGSETPVPTTIEFANGSVAIPGTANLTATVKDQTGAVISPAPAVTFAIEGTAPAGVSIDGTTLKVEEAAAAGTITIRATCGNATQTATWTLTKTTPSKVVTTIDVTTTDGATIAVPTKAVGTATKTFTATVKDQDGEIMTGEQVTWSIPETKGVSIDQNGVVTVTNEADVGKVTVTATSKTASTVKGTAELTITKDDPVATALEIQRENNAVTSDTLVKPTTGTRNYEYKAVLTDQYGAVMSGTTVEWKLEPAISGITLNAETGTVTVSSTAANGTATLTATAAELSTPATVALTIQDATVPDAPTGVTASVSGTTVTVRWTAPANGGAPITGYKVTLGSETKTVEANQTSCTFNNVSYGTYTATVIAVNVQGDSKSGTSNSITVSRPTDNNNSSGSSSNGTSGSSSPAPKPLPDRNQGTTTPANPTTPTNPDDNTPTNPSDSTSFNDVPANHWASAAIDWVNTQGLMNGISGTQFAPDNQTTRQQLWMILARLNGTSPANMAEARTWAMNNGISDGTNADQNMSRQQMVTFLYRYAQQKGYQLTGSADLSSYSDNSAVSGYAREALAWAVANGIVNGTSQTTLSPLGTATRAQFATILQRFYNSVVNK